MFKLKSAGGVAAALAFVAMGAHAQTALWHFEGDISGLQAIDATRSGFNPVNQLGDLALGQKVMADVRVDLAANVYTSVDVTVRGGTDMLFTTSTPQSFSNTNLPGPGVRQYLTRVQASPAVARSPVDMDFQLQLAGSSLNVGAYSLQDIHDALLGHAFSGLVSSSGVAVAFCGKCYIGQVEVNFSSVTVSPVPEPSSRATWGMGLAAMLAGLATCGRRDSPQAMAA